MYSYALVCKALLRYSAVASAKHHREYRSEKKGDYKIQDKVVFHTAIVDTSLADYTCILIFASVA